MRLNKDDLAKISEVLDKFPDSSVFKLSKESCAIGYILNLIIDVNLHGIPGEFKTEISGVDNW